MSKNYTSITFNAISVFVDALNSEFGNSQHTLKLYNRLISKTKMHNKVPIQKHINAFKIFCSENSITKPAFNEFNISHGVEVVVKTGTPSESASKIDIPKFSLLLGNINKSELNKISNFFSLI